MTQAKNGDTVKIHYTGTLSDGRVFESSKEGDPFEFVIGEGNVISGIEKEVEEMSVGDKKQISIPPEEAWGERREDLVVDVPKDEIPENISPEIGMQLQVGNQDGSTLRVTVTHVDDEKVVLDGNHPLAGQTLVFDLELVEIAQ